MKKGKLVVAASLAVALVGGSGTLVWASLNETPALPCADIIDGVHFYKAPKQETDGSPLNKPTWITDGFVQFTMTLAEASCLDVTYGVVALAENPITGNGTPTVLASSAVPGDGVSTTIGFELPVTADPSQAALCIYAFTVGGGGQSSTGKNGAAFDGTTGGTLLDRAPDWKTVAESDPDASGAYCFGTGIGGRGYN